MRKCHLSTCSLKCRKGLVLCLLFLLVTMCLEIYLMPQFIYMSTCSCKAGGRNNILQFYHRGQKNKCLKSKRPPLSMEMRNGTAGVMRTASDGTKVFIWGWCEGAGKHLCDIFVTLVNPFLVLSLLLPLKKLNMSFKGHCSSILNEL